MNRRQALARISAAAVALAFTPKRSTALESFSALTCKEAKALGMTFRAQKAGGPNGVWIEVKFKLKGKLEGIKRVALRMYDGDKLLVLTTLANEEQSAGHYKVSFMADRDLLGKSELWISSSLDGGDASSGAYSLKVSEIDEVKELR